LDVGRLNVRGLASGGEQVGVVGIGRVGAGFGDVLIYQQRGGPPLLTAMCRVTGSQRPCPNKHGAHGECGRDAAARAEPFGENLRRRAGGVEPTERHDERARHGRQAEHRRHMLAEVACAVDRHGDEPQRKAECGGGDRAATAAAHRDELPADDAQERGHAHSAEHTGFFE
jgi:hypothetical protein